MLDPKGMTLDEIKRIYPESFQPLGYDVLFDVDESNKPKLLSSFQMCINSILTLLFMKPGKFPSIPDLGIDIDQYLFEYTDDDTIPVKIKSALIEQCNKLEVIGIDIQCYIDKTPDNKEALVVVVTGTDTLTYGIENNRAIIGITYDNLNRLYGKVSYV